VLGVDDQAHLAGFLLVNSILPTAGDSLLSYVRIPNV
jgi:hypothetical protein